MGKTVHMHPISLYVIRGAAQQAGWRLGRINLRHLTEDYKTAYYHIPIILVPQDLRDLSLFNLRNSLQSCFSQDIRVGALWITHGGVTMCELGATINEELYDLLYLQEWRDYYSFPHLRNGAPNEG